MKSLRSTFKEVARVFGTPTYAYDESEIRAQFHSLVSSIHYHPKKILYAMKANFNPHIIEIFKELGAGIDAVSPGELFLARNKDFFSVFTGNNATAEEMDIAYINADFINIDSLSALEKFGKKYSHKPVGIRINPDVGAGHHDHCITGGPKSKFGIWYSELGKAKRIADKHNLRIVGIHQHIGSQILEVDKFELAMDVLLKEARRFPELKVINFGGGFGVPYRPEEKPLPIAVLGRRMSDCFFDFCGKYGRRLILMIEPGRYLIAESGWLLTRVNTIKRNPNGRTFIGVDSGFNHLLRPAMYGSYHHIINVSNPEGRKEVVDVVGNICESGDKFAEEREIAEPRGGDLLAIATAGAYGYSMASNYNLRGLPAEVLIKPDGNIKLIRERESNETLIRRITGGVL